MTTNASMDVVEMRHLLFLRLQTSAAPLEISAKVSKRKLRNRYTIRLSYITLGYIYKRLIFYYRGPGKHRQTPGKTEMLNVEGCPLNGGNKIPSFHPEGYG